MTKKMTKKIYDNQAEAMAAAEGFRAGLFGVYKECVIEDWKVGDADYLRVVKTESREIVAQFKFKTAPKAGTRGYGWNGYRDRPIDAPIYATTGGLDRGVPRVMGTSGNIISIEHFEPIEPIEPDTELDPNDKEIKRLRGLLTKASNIICLRQMTGEIEKKVFCLDDCRGCNHNERIISGEKG